MDLWKKRKKHVFSLKRERQQLWNLFDRVFPKSVYITEKRRSPRRRGFGSAGDKTSKLNETRRERFRPGIPPPLLLPFFLFPIIKRGISFLPLSRDSSPTHSLFPFPFPPSAFACQNKIFSRCVSVVRSSPSSRYRFLTASACVCGRGGGRGGQTWALGQICVHMCQINWRKDIKV